MRGGIAKLAERRRPALGVLLAVLIATGAAVSVSAIAPAAPADFYDLEGQVRNDRASIGIRFERHGGDRVISPFMADNLRMECRGGEIQRTGTILFGGRAPIQIEGRDRSFSKRVGDSESGGRVTGRLLDGGEARGTVEWHADHDFALRNCDTGELRWIAMRRVP